MAGSFTQVLQINGLPVQQHFSNKALVALTMLTAASDPRQKELMVQSIVNLLSETGNTA